LLGFCLLYRFAPAAGLQGVAMRARRSVVAPAARKLVLVPALQRNSWAILKWRQSIKSTATGTAAETLQNGAMPAIRKKIVILFPFSCQRLYAALHGKRAVSCRG